MIMINRTCERLKKKNLTPRPLDFHKKGKTVFIL